MSAEVGIKKLNPNRARIHRSYTVGEAAALFGVHRNTIREWLRKGLPALDGGKPQLLLGSDLRRFLKARAAGQKKPCGLGKMFCFRCRAPEVPAFGEADYTPNGRAAGNLMALCGQCGGGMNRRIRIEQIPAVFPGVTVQVRQPESRLIQGDTPCVNGDMKRGGKA